MLYHIHKPALRVEDGDSDSGFQASGLSRPTNSKGFGVWSLGLGASEV